VAKLLNFLDSSLIAAKQTKLECLSVTSLIFVGVVLQNRVGTRHTRKC
jgi:hypothetical protein